MRGESRVFPMGLLGTPYLWVIGSCLFKGACAASGDDDLGALFIAIRARLRLRMLPT